MVILIETRFINYKCLHMRSKREQATRSGGESDEKVESDLWPDETSDEALGPSASDRI